MPTTDISEKGLETLIVESLVNQAGYVRGDSAGYLADCAVDLAKLREFITLTQPETAKTLQLDQDCPARTQFLHRLQGEISRRGIVDVLRNGVNHHSVSLRVFFGTPSPGNSEAERLFAANIFSVTRQLRYSRDSTQLALDLCIFINGLPVATFELKNRLTKQTVEDAVQQYKRDRNPAEVLFQFGRCLVHFAVDDQQVWMCAELKGRDSWFLPFNLGYNDGAGNPPNPDGLKTAYLWERTLAKPSITDIIENYAQTVEEQDSTRRTRRRQVFPRYHQLDVVRKLLADAKTSGVGRRYLIQHSAGSGKSNSIAWLSHQLVDLRKHGRPLFDSIIVVTDRLVLDRQLKATIRQFAQVGAVVGHADTSADLRQLLATGKKIIITTVQKFPRILSAIGDEHRGRSFAIIIDEAHSGQGGSATATMHKALGETSASTSAQDSPQAEEEDDEDKINRLMESRKMLTNASYFAFTATPKSKTLELFGQPVPKGEAGARRPFHSYTMKQAIQEGFILDVLLHYTPVASYYQLVKTIEGDPLFDTKRARRKLRLFVESHQYAVGRKAEIIVEHFHDQVAGCGKIGGKARAMVVCSGIARAVQYYHAISACLRDRKSPYKAIVAFSGEHEDGGRKVTEATLNGFASTQIVEKFREEPYRFLVVADKFQTGYDEPLLHTMYVDKPLSGIKAVQTLSRLNRAHPKKTDTFVLDFANDVDTIKFAFDPYYRTTILSEETDPNRLHDLKASLDQYQVYSSDDVDDLVRRFLSGEDRASLDPILDACVALYTTQLDEDGQVDFKGKAKAFVRAYSFLSAILSYSVAAWEKLSIFLNFLIPKLPAPVDPDLSKGILEAIDMDSYRNEVQETIRIRPEDADGEVDPPPTSGAGHKPEPELDRLSSILQAFNEQFADINWEDADRIRKVITEEVPVKVAADQAYQNAMRNSDRDAARLEHDRALQEVITSLLSDHLELFKQFSDNPGFHQWLADAMFGVTYDAPPAG